MLRLLALSLLVVVVGCAAPRPHATIAKINVVAKGAGPDTSGVWDWSFFSRDDQGDERFEREEWHLLQRKDAIEGYYDRVVDMRSVDDRLFRCNQRLSFMKYTRVRIHGQIEGNQVRLREVSYEVKQGPCDDGNRNLVEYRGTLAGGNLALRWSSDGGQTLVRRMDLSRPALAESSGMVEVVPTSDSSPQQQSAAIEGTWDWELRSIDAEGDERVEHEEWHLTESQEGIRGYYDRTVKKSRGETRTFECNGKERFETATRYTVVGQRSGDRVILTEVDYKSEKSACDNALRRLDTYHGKVSDPNTLILSWGPGNQLLHRRR